MYGTDLERIYMIIMPRARAMVDALRVFAKENREVLVDGEQTVERVSIQKFPSSSVRE